MTYSDEMLENSERERQRERNRQTEREIEQIINRSFLIGHTNK